MWSRLVMTRCAARCSVRSTPLRRAPWRRSSHPGCLRSPSSRRRFQATRISQWETERSDIVRKSSPGQGRSRSVSTRCRLSPCLCSRSFVTRGQGEAACWMIPASPSPCTDVLRRLRSNGRHATAAPFRIRPAKLSDVSAVHTIEQEVFSDPWSTQDFRDCVTFALFLVAEEEERVAGYVVALEAADEGEILNLAVAPAGRRRGLGRALVEHMLEALRARGVGQVYLEVRESNASARALYASRGFKEVGRRRQYYRRPVEDAIVLRLDA